MLDKLKTIFGIKLEAATQLPAAPLPKPTKKGGMGFPSFLKSANPARSALSRTDRQLANTDLLSYRSDPDTYKLIRKYVAASPDLSNALFSYLRLGIPSDFSAIARNPDGTVNPEGTALVQQIIARMNYIAPESSYGGETDIRSISEQLARELVLYGSFAGELVLDASRTPVRVMPISVTQIQYWPGKDVKTLEPIQVIGDQKISLALPTVVIMRLDQDILEPYSESMLQSAIKPTLFSEQLAQDLHKIILRSIHPRVHAIIKEDQMRKNGLSPEAQMDQNIANQEYAAMVSDLESKISNLSVDDALVYFDSLEIKTENPGSTGLSSEYETLQKIADARMCAGAKAMPAVLGKGGSQNTASAEVMLFVKSAEGAIKTKLDMAWSRWFSTAIRLFGVDAYVDFRFEEVSMRPKEEMLAFTQTKLSINTDLLSLGTITDEEFSIRMTGELPPASAPKLSGTMFKHGGMQKDPLTSDPIANPSNSGSTLNQHLNPDTPTTGRGGNKKTEQNKKAEDETTIEAQAPTFVTPNITMHIDNTQQPASVLKMKRDEDGNLTIERIADVG